MLPCIDFKLLNILLLCVTLYDDYQTSLKTIRKLINNFLMENGHHRYCKLKYFFLRSRIISLILTVSSSH